MAPPLGAFDRRGGIVYVGGRARYAIATDAMLG